MSGIGKKMPKRIPVVARKPKVTASAKSNLLLPVGRIHRYLRKRCCANNISRTSSVYVAAVLEYLVAEVLEIGGNEAKAEKKKIITPRHLNVGIRNDEDINKLLQDATLAAGGVSPFIHPALRPPRKPEPGH